MSFSSDPSLLVNQLPTSFEIPKDQEISETISLLYRRISRAVNSKEGSLYDLTEQGNFKLFYTSQPYNYRPVYRKSFDLVALNSGNIAGGATVSFAHGITGLVNSALIYASCTSAAGAYFSVMGYPTCYLDATNLNFTNPLPATALTQVSFIAEYLKQGY